MPVLCFYAGKAMSTWLHEGETWDDLLRDQMGVIQPVIGYRFAMDAVLLAHFAAQNPAQRVLDLGTGCGVIALLIASRLPASQVTGVEIQPEQAERAERSVLANGLQSRVTMVSGDLKSLGLLGDEKYDLVTANPPFFPQGRGKLPAHASIAVSRHEIKCTLVDIFSAAARWLSPGGRFAVILPPAREAEALVTAAGVDLKLTRQRAVHPREQQRANLMLLEFKDIDMAGELLEMSPLYVYQADGSYSDEIMAIYQKTSP